MPDSALFRGPFVLLDWDNTLHDAASINLAALQEVLAGYGINVAAGDYRRAYTVDYRAMYRRLGLGEELIEAASRDWRRLVGTAEPHLLPGAAEAIERLIATGHTLALVTSGPRGIVEPQLLRLRVHHRFGTVVYGDGQPLRPDPAPLLRALSGLGTPAAQPDTAAFCSDTTSDMRMARAAGVHAVGITSFAFDAPALRAAGANEVASSVVEWVDRITHRDR